MKYLTKDNNYQNESTTYWFVNNGETFGVVESTVEDAKIVDCDGCPINTDDAGNVHLKILVDLVTDEMRRN